MNKIVVKKSEIKGELKNIPDYVIKMMLSEQVRQGNKLNITIFQNNLLSGRSLGGFDWEKTIQGYNYWRNILVNKDFSEIDRDDLIFNELGVVSSDISGINRKLILKMLEYQEKQGNPRDISVFEKCRIATKESGGFNWEETEEGFDFWDKELTGDSNITSDKIGEMKSIVTLENGEKYLVFAGIAIKLEGTIKSEEWVKNQRIIKKEDL